MKKCCICRKGEPGTDLPPGWKWYCSRDCWIRMEKRMERQGRKRPARKARVR